MIKNNSLNDESIYLDNVLSNLKSLLKNYGADSEKDNSEIVKYRRFLWENRSQLDELEITENCGQVALQEKIHAKKLSRIKTLEKQLNSPYFARLDFKEDNEDTESFYIGLSSIEDEENYDFLVVDWRSPIASMFYDFENGPAYYYAPNGKISGEITFSRQFNIRNGKIIFMHNSNDSLCDEDLCKILNGNATEKMKNIVSTIQKEQNDIIRNDKSKVLFIQGAAGSGKTSIALHRAAYLLYKNRKTLNSDNILIFSPNEVFAEYISHVLPELGESNVLQTTFEQYSKNFLPTIYNFETKNEHLDYIYSDNKQDSNFKTKIKSMEFKNSTSFIDILTLFSKELHKYLLNIKPIILEDKEIVSYNKVKKTFLDRFSNVPFISRIDLVKQSLFSQVESNYLHDCDFSDLNEEKEEFFRLCKEDVFNQIDNMITTFDNVLIYKTLWENISKYTNLDLSEIKNYTLNNLNDKKVNFDDICSIIYIRGLLEGFRSYKNIKHLLIDEAQDYSPLFYNMIKNSFKNANITIMGDLNQRLDNYSNIKEKEGITNLFENIDIAILKRSYRSTANITKFTKELLINHEPIEYVARYGNNPSVYLNYDIYSKTKEIIDSVKNNNCESIAIICKNKLSSTSFYENFKNIYPNINLILDDNCSFNSTLSIIPSYLAKGLEFDAVIIVDAENYLNDDFNNLFYTVCTRALHELHILSNKNIDTILPKDKSLYTLSDRSI